MTQQTEPDAGHSVDMLQEKALFLGRRFPDAGMPDGYRARPEMYKESRGPKASLEQLAFIYDQPNSSAPREYKELFHHVDLEGVAPMRDARQILEDAGFPRIVTDRIGSLSRPVPQRAVEWGKGYKGDGTDTWLWISGGTGAGKTCAAAFAVVLASQRMDSRLAPKGKITYVRAQDMARRADSTNLYGTNTRYVVEQDYIEPAVLVIDDLGNEPVSKCSWQTISNVLDMRHAGMKTTIITTQYGGKEWFGLYSQIIDSHARKRLAGRIAEGLSGYSSDRAVIGVVKIAEADWRPNLQ